MPKKPPSNVWIMVRSASLGLLVAATGVGGSDVSLAALTGSRFGVMLMWAIVAGAFVKYVLNEGLVRWQVATGQTFLEGACHRLGPAARVVFLVYLLIWTFAVGASVMSACAGVASAMITPAGEWAGGAPAETSQWVKVLLGLGHSILAATLVLSGGYGEFKRVMGVLTVVMVVLVVVAAGLTRPDLGVLAGALFVPRIPLDDAQGVQWTIALFGGVGGTVTMLAYGYWMREEGRSARENVSPPGTRSYRTDLAVAYIVTAAFGIALKIVSANVPVSASGANLFQAVAARLQETIGPAAGWVYLAGAWCAVWACMLGVWQFVPMLFAELIALGRDQSAQGVTQREPTRPAGSTSLSRSGVYRAALVALATLPAVGVWFDFALVQRAFGILGSMVIPMMALALLLMNSRRAWVGQYANHVVTNVFLIIVFLLSIAGVVVEFARLLAC